MSNAILEMVIFAQSPYIYKGNVHFLPFIENIS